MTKHSKNNTASSVFSYAEYKKLDYGTKRQRLGNESMRQFDACSLCLQRARDSVCCNSGHLFCKECIYNDLCEFICPRMTFLIYLPHKWRRKRISNGKRSDSKLYVFRKKTKSNAPAKLPDSEFCKNSKEVNWDWEAELLGTKMKIKTRRPQRLTINLVKENVGSVLSVSKYLHLYT